jgi:hypothetical protein
LENDVVNKGTIDEAFIARRFNLEKKVKVTTSKIIIHMSELCHLMGCSLLVWDSFSTCYFLYGRTLDSYIEEDELIWKMML